MKFLTRQKYIAFNKNGLLKCLFGFLIIVIIASKLALLISELNFVRFGSDTMRHIFLLQEMKYLETVPGYGIHPYVNYPPSVNIGDLGLYVRGTSVFLLTLNKITGLDIVYLINILAVAIITGAVSVVFILARRIFSQNHLVAYGASLFLAAALHLLNVTPHYLAAYVMIPLLVWSILSCQKNNRRSDHFLFAVFWLFLQIIHSNYATFFLCLMTGWTTYEFLRDKHGQTAYRAGKILLIALTIYVISAVYYYFFIQARDIGSFVSEYSGIWAIQPSSNNRLNAIAFSVIVVILYIGLIKIIWSLSSKLQKDGTALDKTLADEPGGEKPSHYWLIFVSLSMVSLLAVYLLEFFIDWKLDSNVDLLRLENFSVLMLFIVSLYSIKYIFRRLPKLIFFVYLAFLITLAGTLFVLVFPMTKDLFSVFNTILISVFDFSLFLLSLLAAYSLSWLARGGKQKNQIIASVALSIVLLFFSLMIIYGNKYDTANPHRDFFEAYLWLKPKLASQPKVGSNFEYIRALTYVDKSALIKNLEPDSLEALNLPKFITDNQIDYFILFPWRSSFPIKKWQSEISQSMEVKLIYDRGDAQIYERLR